jgi:hypothetical protein
MELDHERVDHERVDDGGRVAVRLTTSVPKGRTIDVVAIRREN